MAGREQNQTEKVENVTLTEVRTNEKKEDRNKNIMKDLKLIQLEHHKTFLDPIITVSEWKF